MDMAETRKLKAGIIGATGYTGIELVRLLVGHPDVEIALLTSRSYAGQPFSKVFPSFSGIVDLELSGNDHIHSRVEDIDVLFLALPHGLSAKMLQEISYRSRVVIDLGADFRLKNKLDYEVWYDLKHPFPKALKEAVYGLPERHRAQIKKAKLIANPGCYATASELALLPLASAGLLQGPIVDAKSGVSGAGRSVNLDTLYNEVNENLKAYKVAGHRHTPEIEQELSEAAGQPIKITFTPHLIPMQRGILVTAYCPVPDGHNLDSVMALYKDFYEKEPFVRVLDIESAQTRFVRGSNYCDIALKEDTRTGRLIVTSALDNLIKGAAGQAIQNMNLACNLDERAGLAPVPQFL